MKRTLTQCDEKWQQNNARKSSSTHGKQHQCEGCCEENNTNVKDATLSTNMNNNVNTKNNTKGMTTLTQVVTPMQEKIQHEKNTQKNKMKHNQQEEHNYKTKNIIVKKNKVQALFYTTSIIPNFKHLHFLR